MQAFSGAVLDVNINRGGRLGAGTDGAGAGTDGGGGWAVSTKARMGMVGGCGQ